MPLPDLPVELLTLIIASIDSLQPLHALLLANRGFYALAHDRLYELDAQGSRRAIHWAATHGDIILLRKSLDHGAKVPPVPGVLRPGEVDPQQTPGIHHPLRVAVEKGHAAIVDVLLDLECHVRMTNNQKLSLLGSAVTHDHAGVASLLLDRGICQDKPRYYARESPVQIAARKGNLEMVEILLCETNRPRTEQIRRALGSALLAQHFHLVPLLLREDFDLSFHILTTTPSQSLLDTPLCWAARTGQLALARLFLEKGADPDYPRGWETPPLLIAVQERHEELVRLLAPVTHRIHVTRALTLSTEQADGTIARILLETGAHPDHQWDDASQLSSYYGNECTLGFPDSLVPPLIAAVSWGHEALVRMLVEHGADVNAAYSRCGGLRERNVPDGFMGASLLLAMRLGLEEIAAFLRESGGREEAGTWEERVQTQFPQEIIQQFMAWDYHRPAMSE
ncbi:ankyrin repeat-containing domain protein [Aspergillus carlsbadensis]|nr:ankyrin repeat-containing domain protein [Aspergillus carlsbadensis]